MTKTTAAISPTNGSATNGTSDIGSAVIVRDDSHSRLNIGGDTVIQATKDLPENQRESIRWLYSLARSQNWSLTRAADEISRGTDRKMDSTTLSRVFTGTYGAALDSITRRIDKYRSTFEDSARRSRGLFVQTSIAKTIAEAADYARLSKTMVFVYGPSQIGKTTAALEYMAQNNHGATKYVRMPASAGVQLMMKEFARACYVSPNSCFDNLRDYVLNAIDSTHLVFADELHQVFMSYQRGSAIKCLEVIREIHDRRGCGMVCLGTNKLRDELMMGQHQDLLQQFRERGIVEIQLPMQVPKSDLGKIAAVFGLGEPAKDVQEIIDHATKGHGLKRFVLFLESGAALAKKDGARRMSWDHFVRAHDIVEKLAGKHQLKGGAR